MITSLIDLLRDCLPIHAAWSSACSSAGQKNKSSTFFFPSAEDLKSMMRCLGPSDPIAFPVNPVPTIGGPKSNFQKVKDYFGLEEAILTAHLWDFKKGSPYSAVEMNCRARETGYRRHGVLPKVEFGMDGKPEIPIEFAWGQKMTLQLDPKFCIGQFQVKGGWVPAGGRKLWPLQMLHDVGFVLVYVYELSFDDQDKLKDKPDPFKGSGKGNWIPVREMEKRLMEQMVPASVPDKDAWLEAMTGPFMNKSGAQYQTMARTNELKKAKVGRPRIVVAISLGTCRERADFEPGGLVGMSKVFPNIMICSDLLLGKSTGTVRITRTAVTTALDKGDGTLQGTCCNAYDQIGAMYVTDANEVWGDPQKPFWGGTFAYVRTDADKKYGSQYLKVVDRARATERTYKGGKRLLVRRGLDNVSHPFTTEFWWSLWRGDNIEIRDVVKTARQGDWDNIHQSPQLRLDLKRIEVSNVVKDVTRAALLKIGVKREMVAYDNEPEKTGTDRVWMAPFCSHDCLHTHWRWGAKESAEWTKGWDETGPYKVAGAPMVPHYQDVEIKLSGPNDYTYKVTSTYEGKLKQGNWDVHMHHGFAYAQSIAAWHKWFGAKVNLSLEQGARFIDSAGKLLTVANAPLLYWLCRYDVHGKDGKVVVRERHQLSDAEIEGARMK